jgi:2,3-bisphosphoglycerate-dependent phosphoglycerate mutase
MEESAPPTPNCELYLVRHAESEWNASGRWQGHADPPLSPDGRGQASALVARLEAELDGSSVTGLVCSDLGRARETAAELGRKLGLIPVSDPGLRELDIGEWSGLRRAEIAARDPEILARFEANDANARPPGGETRRELRHRARWAVRRIANGDPWGRVVIVSHLGLIRALLPGAEPNNADFMRVSAADALTRRLRFESGDEGTGEGPL